MKALLVVLTLAGVATAGPKVEPAMQAKADAMFVKGQVSYQDGKYQAAITQFKQAYDLVKDPVYLFNIAQSYRKIGDCVAAYEHYNQYLDAAPTAENKDKVKQWVIELKPCVDQRQHEQEEAAHKAQAEAERRRQEDDARRAANTAPRAEERDSGQGFRISGIAVAGIGAVGLGVGIAYGIRGQNLKTQVDQICGQSCQWDSPMIQDLDKAGTAANQRAWIGYVGGGVLVAAGVGLYFYGRTRVETVMVTPTPGGAAVSAQTRF